MLVLIWLLSVAQGIHHHYSCSYIQNLAEQGRIPIYGKSLISNEITSDCGSKQIGGEPIRGKSVAGTYFPGTYFPNFAAAIRIPDFLRNWGNGCLPPIYQADS